MTETKTTENLSQTADTSVLLCCPTELWTWTMRMCSHRPQTQLFVAIVLVHGCHTVYNKLCSHILQTPPSSHSSSTSSSSATAAVRERRLWLSEALEFLHSTRLHEQTSSENKQHLQTEGFYPYPWKLFRLAGMVNMSVPYRISRFTRLKDSHCNLELQTYSAAFCSYRDTWDFIQYVLF